MKTIRLACTLAEAVDAVWEEVHVLHWGLGGTMMFESDPSGQLPPEDAEMYSLFEGSDQADVVGGRAGAVWEHAWLKPDVLHTLSRFVRGDWTNVAGFRTLPGPREDARIDDVAWLEGRADIYFACVDAAFWEVGTSREDLLRKLLPFAALVQ